MDRRELLKAAGLLLGVAVTPSCRQALESGADLTAAPVAGSLSAEQQAVIARCAELIIPETDTPGAIAAKVPEFIHQVVVDWYTPQERAIFLDGLAELDRRARGHWDSSFVGLDVEQQTQLLTEFEPPLEGSDGPGLQAAFMPAGAAGDLPFYLKLKELTVLGYYSSEVGATSELVYMPVPGRYEGDHEFATSGKQWSI